ADDVTVDAAREQDQPALACGCGHCGRELRRRFGKLEREHRPDAAHLTSLATVCCKVLEALADRRADRFPARTELRSAHLFEYRYRRSTRDGSSTERAAEAARRHRVHQLRASRHACERQAAAERLPGDEEVGLDAVVLDRPHGPGPADARLDLVVDVEDP